MFAAIFTTLLAASAAFAHSALETPTPRRPRTDSAYQNRNDNACGFGGTNIPAENNFQRGQKVPLKWAWNNHQGGFIKMSIIQGIPDFADSSVQDAFLKLENTLQFQCYTRQCDRSGFDPGFTKFCEGKELEFPNWLADGEYTLQWSQYSGYDSEAVPTRQLPIYHSCANIRINGGVPFVERPTNWMPPFFGGDQVQINGESSGPDRCAFKRFAGLEPSDPSKVDTKNDDGSLIHFGSPFLASLDSVDLVQNNLFANGQTPALFVPPPPSAPAPPAPPAGGNNPGGGDSGVIAIPSDPSNIDIPALQQLLQQLQALLDKAAVPVEKRSDEELFSRLGHIARRQYDRSA